MISKERVPVPRFPFRRDNPSLFIRQPWVAHLSPPGAENCAAHVTTRSSPWSSLHRLRWRTGPEDSQREVGKASAIAWYVPAE